MSSHKEKSATDFQVDDPAAAFRKMEEATRKIMAVSKKAKGEAAARGNEPKKKLKRD